MMGLCGRCGAVGIEYGDAPDVCLGELEITSVCCGHGRKPSNVMLQAKNGTAFEATINAVYVKVPSTDVQMHKRVPFDEWVLQIVRAE